jgi:hypothetical protein
MLAPRNQARQGPLTQRKGNGVPRVTREALKAAMATDRDRLPELPREHEDAEQPSLNFHDRPIA